MESSVSNIVGITVDGRMYTRLLRLAAQEDTTVPDIIGLALSVYLEVLSDAAIVDQLHGDRRAS